MKIKTLLLTLFMFMFAIVNTGFACNLNPVEFNNQRVVIIKITSDLGEQQATGFFIGEGKILTNQHVTQGLKHVTIETYDNETFIGTVVKEINVFGVDLAMIQTDAIEYPYFEIERKTVEKGTEITMIGSPVYDGVVHEWEVTEGKVIETFYKRIAIDAVVIGGGSGSPAFDEDGNLIGIAFGSATMVSNIGGIRVDKEIGLLVDATSIYEFVYGEDAEFTIN